MFFLPNLSQISKNSLSQKSPTARAALHDLQATLFRTLCLRSQGSGSLDFSGILPHGKVLDSRKLPGKYKEGFGGR